MQTHDDDKINDLKVLLQLYQDITNFEGLGRKSTKLTAIKNLLDQISKACSSLKWNNDNKKCIRNLYGKINYSSGQENSKYIDFERLSFLTRFPNEEAKDNIARIIQTHFDIFSQEFKKLKGNIGYILKTEHSQSEKELSEDIIAQINDVSKAENGYPPVGVLLHLISFYYDRIFIDKICQKELIQALNDINHKKEQVKWLYTFARVISIIGEAAKCLSSGFKDKYYCLSLTNVAKLRDHFNHSTRHIKRPDEMAKYLEVVKNYLPSLQKSLKSIKNSFPALNGTSARNLALLQDHAKTCSEILPLDQQKLCNGKLTKENLESYCLRSLRIKILNKRRLDTQKKVNTHKQLQNNHPPVPNVETVSAVKLDKIIQMISELELKASLTEKEKSQLKSAHKTKKKLENEQPKTQPQATNNTIAMSNPADNMEEIESELKTLELGWFIQEILSHPYKPQKKNQSDKPYTIDEKLHRTMIDLKEELIILKSINNNTIGRARNYAHECCLAIIGQLMRDLRVYKHALLDELKKSNYHISESFNVSIATRNEKIAHDPFSNHSEFLNAVALNHALPLLQDISAIETLTGTKDEAEITKSIVTIRVKIYIDIANAYMRLGILDKAEQNFKIALEFAIPEEYALMHLNNGGFSYSNPKVEKIERFGCAYTASVNGLRVVCIDDPFWVSQRVSALYYLANCYIKQSEFNKALPHLEEALEIYSSFAGYKTADRYFLLHLKTVYIYTLCNTGFRNLEEFNEFLGELKRTDYDNYAYILINYAAIISRQDNAHKDAIKILDDIKESQLQSIRVKIMIASVRGEVLAFYAIWFDEIVEIVERTKGSHAISGNAVKLREQAISCLFKAVDICEVNLAELKDASGNSALKLLYHPTLNNTAKVLGSLAVNISLIDPDEAYDLIKRALQLQTKYGFNTEISYDTLGSTCEKMFDKHKEEKYLHEARKAYQENCSRPNKFAIKALVGQIEVLFKLIKIADEKVNLDYIKKPYNKCLSEIEDRDYFLPTELQHRIKLELETFIKNLSVKFISRRTYKEGLDLFAKQKYTAAITCFEKALSILKSSGNNQSEDIATLNYNIGTAYFRLQSYKTSLKYLQLAYSKRLHLLGAEHEQTNKAKNRLQECLGLHQDLFKQVIFSQKLKEYTNDTVTQDTTSPCVIMPNQFKIIK